MAINILASSSQQTDRNQDPPVSRLPRGVAVAATFLLAVGIIIARRPDAVVHPVLWAEDGMYWFSGAYNSGPWSPLLQAHTGYLQTYSRLIADLGLLLPIREVPTLFVWAAIVVQALPAALLASRRFDHLLSTGWIRYAAIGIYLALPNSFEVNANLTNAQWHLALLALLCLLAEPGNHIWRVFDIGAVVLSGLTGPFAIILVIAGIVWLLPVPRRRWHVVLWCLTACLAAIQGIELLTSPRAPGMAPLGPSITRLIAIIGSQVGLGGMVGTSGLMNLAGHSHLFTIQALGFVAFVVVTASVLLRAPLSLRIGQLYAVGVLGASLLSPVTTPPSPQWQVLITANGARYWFIPILFYLWGALWLAKRAGDSILDRREANRKNRLPGVSPTVGLQTSHRLIAFVCGVVGVAVLVVAVSKGMPSDWSYPALAPVHDGPAIAALHRARPGSRVVFPIDPPGWTMVLVKH